MSDDLFRFECKNCGKTVKASSKAVGKVGTCPGCGSKVIVPTVVTAPIAIPPINPSFQSSFWKNGRIGKYAAAAAIVVTLMVVIVAMSARESSRPAESGGPSTPTKAELDAANTAARRMLQQAEIQTRIQAKQFDLNRLVTEQDRLVQKKNDFIAETNVQIVDAASKKETLGGAFATGLLGGVLQSAVIQDSDSEIRKLETRIRVLRSEIQSMEFEKNRLN